MPVEIKGLPAVGAHNLQPVLRYGGKWDPEALEKQSQYNPEEEEEHLSQTQKILTAISQFQKEQGKKQTAKFGDGPPRYGQWLTRNDIKILPDMIETFGDFWVVIKWAMRNRQVIKASELHKNYDRIFADAEVKTGDYAREIFIRKNPQEGI